MPGPQVKSRDQGFCYRCRSAGIGMMRPRISLRNRYVYFPIAKAANSTVKWMLYNLETHGRINDESSKAFRNQNQKILVHDNLYGPLLTPWQIANFQDIDRRLATQEEFFKFSFVRNPFTRVLSAYLDRAQRKNTGLYKMIRDRADRDDFEFKKMLSIILEVPDDEREIHARAQVPQSGLTVFPEVKIGRFETLKEDFISIATKIYPKVDLTKESSDIDQIMTSPTKTGAVELVQKYYDAEAIEMVLAAYETDFANLGYSRDLEGSFDAHGR